MINRYVTFLWRLQYGRLYGFEFQDDGRVKNRKGFFFSQTEILSRKLSGGAEESHKIRRIYVVLRLRFEPRTPQI
jgi:hypothetical protein